MIHNDIFRRLRYALNLKNTTMVKIFALSDKVYDEAAIILFLKKEEDEGYLELSDDDFRLFLDGLITYKRGPSDKKPQADSGPLTNNKILKKIRIALKIQEDDMLKIFKLAGFEVSKYEISALFRREGHKNFQ